MICISLRVTSDFLGTIDTCFSLYESFTCERVCFEIILFDNLVVSYNFIVCICRICTQVLSLRTHLYVQYVFLQRFASNVIDF